LVERRSVRCIFVERRCVVGRGFQRREAVERRRVATIAETVVVVVVVRGGVGFDGGVRCSLCGAGVAK